MVAPIGSRRSNAEAKPDDDAAEAVHHTKAGENEGKGQKRSKSKGQNMGRDFGSSRDAIGLCSSRATYPEFSPKECPFGVNCKFEHNLRRYLEHGKRGDLKTFSGGLCPVWEVWGICDMGWKCRFASSHMQEVELPDGRMELTLTVNESKKAEIEAEGGNGESHGVVNVVSTAQKQALTKRKMDLPKSKVYLAWLEQSSKEREQEPRTTKQAIDDLKLDAASNGVHQNSTFHNSRDENRALYHEPPFLPSEKRRIYFGPETPALAPLTTQGNLPFRRLCVELGAQATYSEMAMSLPLMQGTKQEWALMKAHQIETTPPAFKGEDVVHAYDNAKDLKFGAQIAASKPWQAIQAAEILSTLCPRLRVIDLNCGCPIDLVYRQGAGSALLDTHPKLERMVRGMHAVSGEIPITVKVRMGTKDSKPTALKLIERLMGSQADSAGQKGAGSGVAAFTLHGRSRQQRYTKRADWEYISECAALIQRINEEERDLADTVREVDQRSQPNGKVFFLGNGDCYSHVDYSEHIKNAKVDSVMIARGALIKPWIFQEIETGQYLDISASQRLEYVEKFAKYGLEAWGSDEIGLGTTRKFLLEWLSFAYRYVPLGILEHLPPNLQDRPPAFKGRNELETLLASDNYKDWIKIR